MSLEETLKVQTLTTDRTDLKVMSVLLSGHQGRFLFCLVTKGACPSQLLLQLGVAMTVKF